MRILTVPEDSSVLRQKSRPVKKIDQNLARFMGEMGKTLKSQHDPEGVGLSAVQIGRPVRIFALNWKFLKKLEESGRLERLGKSEVIYYINPEIIAHSEEKTLGKEIYKEEGRSRPARFAARRAGEARKKEEGETKPFLEGCLSVPEVYGEVLRWTTIKVKSIIVGGTQLLPAQIFNFSRTAGFRQAGQFSIFNLSELAARVFQHELDHLNGILFTDHVLKEGSRLYKLQNDEMIEMTI